MRRGILTATRAHSAARPHLNFLSIFSPLQRGRNAPRLLQTVSNFVLSRSNLDKFRS
jgi:hypothetical protein